MREILFKAKTKLEVGQNNGGKKDGVWVKGHYRDKVGRPTISQFEFDRADYIDYEIDRETLSQYTGLKDKHGNKIFENDIVKWGHFNTIESPIRIAKVEMKPDIRFNSNVGVFQYGEFAYQDTENYLEVIGNKFDNPELLEKVEE